MEPADGTKSRKKTSLYRDLLCNGNILTGPLGTEMLEMS